MSQVVGVGVRDKLDKLLVLGYRSIYEACVKTVPVAPACLGGFERLLGCLVESVSTALAVRVSRCVDKVLVNILDIFLYLMPAGSFTYFDMCEEPVNHAVILDRLELVPIILVSVETYDLDSLLYVLFTILSSVEF